MKNSVAVLYGIAHPSIHYNVFETVIEKEEVAPAMFYKPAWLAAISIHASAYM